jgi:sorting nexin-25
MQQRQYLFLAFLGLLVLLNTVATTWLPSLRLIIWAFFAGCVVSLLLSVAAVLLTSTTTHVGDGDYNPLRNIKPLALATTAIWEQEVAAAAKEDVFERPPLYPPSFPISQALDQLLDNVNRDFINSWYTKVSPDPSFSLQVEKTIRHTLLSISQRLQTVDLPVLVVGRVVPLLTAHLHDFSVAEKTVRGSRLEVSLTESEELDLAIASKYRNGRLHAAAGLGSADMKEAQLDHLRKIVDKLLPLVLPDSEKKSRVVCIIIREIVACSILFTTLSMLSDPDFWNRIIEQIVRLFFVPLTQSAVLLTRIREPQLFRIVRQYGSFVLPWINMQTLTRQPQDVTRSRKQAPTLTILNLSNSHLRTMRGLLSGLFGRFGFVTTFPMLAASGMT